MNRKQSGLAHSTAVQCSRQSSLRGHTSESSWAWLWVPTPAQSVVVHLAPIDEITLGYYRPVQTDLLICSYMYNAEIICRCKNYSSIIAC